MDFRVDLSDQAQADIAGIYDWLRSQRAGDAAERWFVDFRIEVRQMLYGHRPHIYRILFAIEGDVVQVLHVRHGRRRPIGSAT